jgi:hypothetical protein
MGTNDVTGDRITSKVSKDINTYKENIEKIFGKKKETNGGWKYEPDNVRSVTTDEDKMER